MTQGDLLPYPLDIRPCHVIYGQPLTFFVGQKEPKILRLFCFEHKIKVSDIVLVSCCYVKLGSGFMPWVEVSALRHRDGPGK